MSEIKYNPDIKNSREAEETINEVNAELGEKELEELSIEELENLYQSTEQESYIANDVNYTRIPEEHRQDVQIRLNRITLEIAKRKDDKINSEVKDLGDSVN